MWKSVGKFLERFANLKPSGKLIREENAKIISAILNIEINPEILEERNGILYLKSENPALKNEIFLQKELILEKLKEKLGKNSPRDLRF